MSPVRRTLWEVVILVALVLAAGVAFKIMERGWRQRIVDEHQRSESELTAVRAQMQRLGESMAEQQTEAVLKAFVAGIQPSMLAGRESSVDAALGQMLEIPEVVFVHVLRPDGTVVATSDRKLTATGEAGVRGRWALEAGEVILRKGEIDGTTEAAVPVPTVSEGRVIVWIGYDTSRLIREHSPGPSLSAGD